MTSWRTTAVRHARRAVAGIAATLTVARVLLWIAKALATAGTVDTALAMIGLHGPVDEFEARFDAAIEPLVVAVRAGWDAYQGTRAT